MTGQRVLVIDDELALRAVLCTLLADEGYTARMATDGADALALLQTWRPELILLDLMMPGMDGWSFRHVQLADPSLASIPVVILSATYEVGRVNDEPPVTAVMAKPYDFDALLNLVATLLEPAGSFH